MAELEINIKALESLFKTKEGESSDEEDQVSNNIFNFYKIDTIYKLIF